MAAFDQIVEGVKDVLRMSGEIKRLADAVRELGVEVREIDRRLVRIETMAELSRSGRASRRLPPKA